jgi:hypothetical protein
MLFESHGLAVVTTQWLGSCVERLFHHPLLFVLDKSPLRTVSSVELDALHPGSMENSDDGHA